MTLLPDFFSPPGRRPLNNYEIWLKSNPGKSESDFFLAMKGAPGNNAPPVTDQQVAAQVAPKVTQYLTENPPKPGKDGAVAMPRTPAPITVLFGTATQPSDPTKGAFVSIMIEVTYNLISGALAFSDEVEARIGPDATVATGGGTPVSLVKFGFTGLIALAGTVYTQRQQMSILVPVGWYFAIRRTAGVKSIVTAAIQQPLG